MKKLKGDDKEEVGKVIAQGEKAIREMREEVVEHKEEVKQLKSKRNVDKYKVIELGIETMKKFSKIARHSGMHL